uniref:Uncharacterized protein n=1 Tax=Meloidogyne enterolobii TaxID=390850 RepID=A0A6V7U8N0_MELEN|nr:unnamed protein product [Meloidogyne enterolobii]
MELREFTILFRIGSLDLVGAHRVHKDLILMAGLWGIGIILDHTIFHYFLLRRQSTLLLHFGFHFSLWNIN